MKKIVRLTESDLVRLIKKIIREDQTQQNTDVKSMTGPCKLIRQQLDDFGTDEDALYNAIMSINQNNYADTLKCLQNWSIENDDKPCNYISCYIGKEMSFCDAGNNIIGDRDEVKQIIDMNKHLSTISGGKDTLFNGFGPEYTYCGHYSGNFTRKCQ